MCRPLTGATWCWRAIPSRTADHELLLHQLRLGTAEAARAEAAVLKPRRGASRSLLVVPTFGGPITENQYVIISQWAELAKSG